jgi:hypothetical protein
MGKREVLIVAGFVVVGALVYQFTAPPSTEGSSSFSFANIFREVGREMRGNPGRATVTHSASLPVTPGLREVRILGVGRGGVTVVGERRTDITYALTVASNGPDDEQAKVYADRTVFVPDQVADTIVLRVAYPTEATQTATATLRVPSNLVVRVENATGVTMSDLAGAQVEATRGAVNISDVSGMVEGTHLDGSVTVTGAGSVKMRLTRLRSRFEDVSGGLTLDIRDGECTIATSHGAADIESLRGEVNLIRHQGPITVRGNAGRVTLENPGAESRIDMRRTEVEVTMDASVPVTILTTDQTARVIVKETARFVLDAMTTGGRIQATDMNLTPETIGDDVKLLHTFGTGSGARVTVRNTRGDIVVRR